jgi:hypothetical protein
MVVAQLGSSVRQVSLSGGLIGVQAAADSVEVSNSVIRDMADAGVAVSGTARVVNNTIVRNGSAAIRSTGSVVARNNIVQENAIGLLGAILSSYNDVSDGYSGTSPGPGDQARLVSFLDPSGGDYRERPMQPSLDTGDPSDDFQQEPQNNGGRINQGAFGNTAFAATSPASSRAHLSRGCGLIGLEGAIFLAAFLFALRRR